MRFMIVPSEKPASTSLTIASLSSVGVFSSSTEPPPASVGGRIIRTVALPVVSVSPSLEPFMPRPRVCAFDDPFEPKISVPLACGLSPFFSWTGFCPPLKNASSLTSSPVDRSDSSCASIARMMFSLTPLCFISIKRSGLRSNLLGREWIIAITVFSLKPVRTNLITEAFVSTSLRC